MLHYLDVIYSFGGRTFFDAVARLLRVMRANMASFCFFSSRRRHTRYIGDWSSDVCSSDLVLHALTAQSDACADRVHLLVTGPDRQFSAETGFPRDAFDFDRAVADFRDLQLEQ